MHYQIFLFRDWLSDGGPLDLARFEASMAFPFPAFEYLAAPISRSRPGPPEQKP